MYENSKSFVSSLEAQREGAGEECEGFDVEYGIFHLWKNAEGGKECGRSGKTRLSMMGWMEGLRTGVG